MAEAIFFLAQATCVYVYLCLLIYIAGSRSNRTLRLLFVLIALIQIFDSYSFFLVHATGVGSPDAYLSVLRMRWAVLVFVPGLFLHLATQVQDGRARQTARRLTVAAYGLAAGFAAMAFSGGLLLEGWVRLGPLLPNLVVARSTPLGVLALAGIIGFGILTVTPLLCHAVNSNARPRLRSDARRMLYPWMMIGSAYLIRALALLPGLPIDLYLAWLLATLPAGLTLLGGAILFTGVLRFGSPVGQPAGYEVPPAAIVASVLSLGSMILVAEHGDILLLANVSLLGGALSGLAMSRPRAVEWAERLLGPRSVWETEFRRLLRVSWRRLTSGELGQEHIDELARALRNELGAEYLDILRPLPDAEPGYVAFGRQGCSERVQLPADFAEWPLTEAGLRRPVVSQGLPTPIHLILPVQGSSSLRGIVVVGEPARGGSL